MLRKEILFKMVQRVLNYYYESLEWENLDPDRILEPALVCEGCAERK